MRLYLQMHIIKLQLLLGQLLFIHLYFQFLHLPADALEQFICLRQFCNIHIIEIDIPNRSINVKLSEAELAARPQRPMTRKRVVPKSLKAYASMVSSADKGGVRMID